MYVEFFFENARFHLGSRKYKNSLRLLVRIKFQRQIYIYVYLLENIFIEKKFCNIIYCKYENTKFISNIIYNYNRKKLIRFLTRQV